MCSIDVKSYKVQINKDLLVKLTFPLYIDLNVGDRTYRTTVCFG